MGCIDLDLYVSPFNLMQGLAGPMFAGDVNGMLCPILTILLAANAIVM